MQQMEWLEMNQQSKNTDRRKISSYVLNNLALIQVILSGIIALIFSQLLLAKTESIVNGNQKITIRYASELNSFEQQKTKKWLQNVTDSLLMIYQKWPKDKFEINVRVTARGRGPVPWGQVERDNTDKVTLYINPDYGFDAIEDDWTVYHELSHLLLPYRGYGDLWISEGLASYYQNILQARSGRLNEKQFWDNIISGFERGKDQSRWSEVSLSTISDNMRRYKEFMRVHWSGVLFWLQADVKLRTVSQNRQSLDTLLQKLKICCENTEMSAREIMSKLDKLSGYKIFLTSFNKFRKSYKMPDYMPLIKHLGVQKNNKLIEKNEQAESADIAKKIFTGNGVH
ncbi:MAG TPA: hypothetical protein ENJ60_13825 [Aeromonadales bacterium]|nr:hypothetical protein [Aeromonadales bacterium]